MKFLLVLIIVTACVGAKAQGKHVVYVNKFKNNKGVCIICLYDNENAFAGKGSPVKCSTVSISNKTATTTFTEVAVGTYAVSVIHDANNNKKFDTNFLGIPTEGYGASQNDLPFAAAPKFKDNKFTVATNSTTISNISLRYIF